jgi:hypothetical protein
MGKRQSMVRRLLCAGLAGLCLAALGGPVAAQADTADIIAPQNSPADANDGWQAGTCLTEPCSPSTPGAYYTQAAGHPPIGFTQFIVKHTTVGPLEDPVGVLKDVRVDLPVGLSVNPQATPQCDLATFTTNPILCPPNSVVGASIVTTALAGVVAPPITLQVYNLVPSQGEPALFGFSALGSNIFLKSDVDWSGDYHEGFTIAVPPAPLGAKILKNRLAFSGLAGNGTFLTTPSTCHDPAQAAFAHTYSTYLRADSVEIPDPAFPNGSSRFEAATPPGVKPTGCALVPFKPGIAVTPGTDRTDSPAGATVDVTVPFEPLQPLAHSNVRTARTTLPLGMGLNPSAAEGLAACTDAQLGKGTRNPVACPAASKIGTVAVETPPLPPGSLTGNVFVGKQLSRDPTSGEEYRIFIDAESARYGVSARLIGNVAADPRTGRLTTTLAENPQVPFSSFKLHFDEGQRAVLSSPPVCGPNESIISADPYTETATATAAQSFTHAAAPDGSGCAKTLGGRPFSPGFSTNAKSTKAGAYSPFSVHISRANGEQEVKGVDVTLPAGLSGKLKGIPYCKPKQIAAAADRAGEAEDKSSSCPSNSKVGVATIRAGTGSSPIQIKGNAYLAGPYKGAPLSLAVLTPALAGPFDLGTVVVRVALFVDPETARIRPVSDPIPDVFGGAKLSIRSIDVNTNRHNFTINPTSCAKLMTNGVIKGGGSDPTTESAFSAFPVVDAFKTSACRKLKFRPKLATKVLGGRKAARRAQNPKFRAILTQPKGNANIRQATVTLPKALILDQSHIKTICTRPDLAAGKCPKASVYGHAAATSPLLGKQLRGPVYLVPSTHILPDLLVDLRGQVNVRLRGSVESVKGGRLRNVFYGVPDVPVTKFVLTMNGGKRGLLTNTKPLCAGKFFSKSTLRAQNGKKARNKRMRLQVPACGGKHKKHKKRG